MKTAELRQAYLQFFEQREHTVVPSSSLVPANDPTLLFTNSGMVQFKDALAGTEKRSYTRATSAQRCVRAGGKHNDLENVGYTARHHTFFEMLGNFSFGDYFKDDTIAWAWQFVTGELGIPRERLWVTVHHSDDEAARIWRDHIGVPADRIVRLGDADNFWSMGDTGPCGPCTEIFYDHGPSIAGGPPGSADEDGDRFVEFWNLVFPQYERHPDGTLEPLASPGVDTGMGLERTAAILQGVHSNYEIDLFQALLRTIGSMAGIDASDVMKHPSLRVVADHIRSSAFLITDGVLPGNEERAYVLRRIIRRALRHGHQLGIEGPFFYKLVEPLAEQMADAYPELGASVARVAGALEEEERRFGETLHQGMEILERSVRELNGTEIPGELAFKLYDTYGFPLDLTVDVMRERGLSVDTAGFDAAMQAQRDRARKASSFGSSAATQLHVDGNVSFSGYERTLDEGRIEALFRVEDGVPVAVERLADGDAGIVVLDETPFYAESGGQVGDMGELVAGAATFTVVDTRKSGGQHTHHGTLTGGTLEIGERVVARVDEQRRARIRLNHSATHLMHAALREVLGSHVQQRGSLVDDERLRFDFSHPQPMRAEEIERVEALVNEQIRANTPIQTELLSYDAALERGAMALFGEKYGDEVRVLTMGNGWSVELCGGTHASRTGDIGVFRIVSETGIQAGVRRIEAITGPAALAAWRATEQALLDVAGSVRAPREEVVAKVQQVVSQNRELARTVDALKAQLASSRSVDLTDEAVEIDGVNVLAVDLGAVDPKSLLDTMDTLKSRLNPAVVLLAAVNDGRIALVAGVSSELTDRFSAAALVEHIGPMLGCKGGGRPDLARAGGGDAVDQLPRALAAVRDWVSANVA